MYKKGVIMNNIIIGNGQVSQALQPHLIDYKVYDITEWEDLEQSDNLILHICIPYSNQFNNIVFKAQNVFNPDITLIHSTVKPGTSESLQACYSPVMGRHENNFQEDVKKYTKFFSGDLVDFEVVKKQFNLVLEYFSDNSRELEYAKIMSTGFMYWNLVYSKIMHGICERRGYDFNNVYTRWNKNYNRGVKEEWKRPIYDYDENPVAGGHCLNSNIYLDDNFINQFLINWQENKGDMNIIMHNKG